jgi:hypothetical protein
MYKMSKRVIQLLIISQCKNTLTDDGQIAVNANGTADITAVEAAMKETAADVGDDTSGWSNFTFLSDPPNPTTSTVYTIGPSGVGSSKTVTSVNIDINGRTAMNDNTYGDWLYRFDIRPNKVAIVEQEGAEYFDAAYVDAQALLDAVFGEAGLTISAV